MSRRAPSGPAPRRTKPAPKPANPWIIRVVAVVAIIVVVAAIAVAAAQGVLFTVPGGR